MIKRIPKKKFEDIYSTVPRLCVELVIKNPQGTLLVKRDIPPGIGKWYLPGGTVFYDENIEEAVKRVGQEELEVKVTTSKFLNYLDWGKSENAFGHAVSLMFLVEVEGEIRLDYQSSEFRFFKEAPENMMEEYMGLKNLFSSI